MFRRKCYDRLLEWKRASNGKTAVLVEGARRVGKTTLARAFAAAEYEDFIYIDFSTAPKAVVDLFRNEREDVGAFPFSYIPNDVKDFDGTMSLVDEIANLRGADDRFGVVTKGLVKLDWSEFEHLKGAQTIGVSSRALKENRIERKKKIWRYIQAAWLANSDKAYAAVKRMRELKGGDLTVLALVEDGMFEENIMFPVALYSEMLWDTEGDLKEITKAVAMRGYVDFA